MIRINLLPEGKPTKKKKGVSALGAAGQLNVILLAFFIAVGLIAIGIRWFMLQSKINDLNREIEVANKEVKRLQAVLDEVRDFEEKKTKLTKKVEVINQLQQNQRGPVRLMDEVSRALPDLLWLDRMEYKGTSINVGGVAVNQTAVGIFIENLKKVSSFQEPTLKNIIQASVSQQTVYKFELGFGFSNIDKTQLAPPPATTPTPTPAPAASNPTKAAHSMVPERSRFLDAAAAAG